MKAKVWRRVTAVVAAGASALALTALFAATAMAAPTMVVNGRLVELGQGGAFRFQPQDTSSTGSTVGIWATTAVIIIVVVAVSLMLDRQASTRLAAVPDMAAGDERRAIGDRQEIAGAQSSEHDQERKAA